MFSDFTARAIKTIAHANEEAHRLNHNSIGNEHILLGLLNEDQGIAATVLRNLGASLETGRVEVERLVPAGPERIAPAKLPQTPTAKHVIERAMVEAELLMHGYVGTEHLLLGLIYVQEGVAVKALANLGLSTMAIRKEIESLLGTPIRSGPDSEREHHQRVWFDRKKDELLVPLLCRALALAIDDEKCLAVRFAHYERAAELRDFHERFKDYSKNLIEAVEKSPV